jgi:hypothetical protein
MQCWKCDRPARGVCRFCGRAVCQEHAGKKPFILTIYVGEHRIPKVVAVANALYCGVCQPQDPIEMPELY